MYFQTRHLRLAVIFSTILLPATLSVPIEETDYSSNGILAEDKEFCYTDPDCDPDTDLWGGECHTGTHQSPISIPHYAPVLPGGTHLHLNTYRAPSFRMRNNGHSVQIEFLQANGTKPVGLSSYRYEGYQPIDYVLDNCHFHWGAEDNRGSEHVFDGGQHFSMELHLVHYRSDYSGTTSALNTSDPNALAVIGILLNVTAGQQQNPQLALIVENLASIQHHSQTWTYVNKPLDFTSFLPRASQNYMHTYKGSLTTPQCDEKVNWFVFSRPVPISHDDVQQFRTLEDGNGEILKENHRPVQPRNGRTVYLTPTAAT